jgi:hypothetical protein
MVDQRVQSDTIGTALLATGLLMTAVSVLDLLSNLWPFSPGSIEWRYGAIGIMSGFAVTPLLGLVLLMIGAELRNLTGMVKAIGYLNVALAVLLGLILLLFLLDGLQIRQMAPEQRQAVTSRAVVIAAVRLIGGLAAFAVVGRAALRLSAPGRREASPKSPIVGRSS